jgi:hypothetical protein
MNFEKWGLAMPDPIFNRARPFSRPVMFCRCASGHLAHPDGLAQQNPFPKPTYDDISVQLADATNISRRAGYLVQSPNSHFAD